MRTRRPRNAYCKARYRAEYVWFSISDSLPLVSMSAARAAHEIIASCKRGDAELVLPIWTRVSVVLAALVPNLTAEVLTVVDRMLPGYGGIGHARARGAESQSRLTPRSSPRLAIVRRCGTTRSGERRHAAR